MNYAKWRYFFLYIVDTTGVFLAKQKEKSHGLKVSMTFVACITIVIILTSAADTWNSISSFKHVRLSCIPMTNTDAGKAALINETR